MRRLALCLLALSLPIFPAKKERDWKTAKVADSVTTLNAGGARAAADTHVITIQGNGTTYTLKERNPWHDECLFVIGENVKFAEDGQRLALEDASGTHCTFAILDQKKLP